MNCSIVRAILFAPSLLAINCLAHASEIEITSVSGDWTLKESLGAIHKYNWGCFLEYKSEKHNLWASYTSNWSSLSLHESNNIFGEKHWLYASEETVTAKIGDDQFIFNKYGEGEAGLSLHLKGHQFYFLRAISKFENIELLVQPNNSSEKDDRNKPIFSIRQRGLKLALEKYNDCLIRHLYN